MPERTEIINKYKKVGNLSGTGNHCDFLASIDLVTELSKEEIEEYYKEVTFPAAHKNHDKVGVRIYFSDKRTDKDTDVKLYYCIEIYDFGYSEGFDLRCS